MDNGQQKQELVTIALALRRRLRSVLVGDVDGLTVYNPLEYAFEPYRRYLNEYGATPKEVVLVGMNPGPWGMVQTGVPFGDVSMVRDWLGLEAPVGRPAVEHPRRPVEGFSCHRGEGSGRRLWGWAKNRSGSPERFFKGFFVLNYCPLAFFHGSEGKNVTPDYLPTMVKERLFPICDEALRGQVRVLKPKWVLGLGNFAAERIRSALDGTGIGTGRLLHPSPANPAANRGWAEAVEKEMKKMGIVLDAKC